ncbi:MAG: aspartate aminotransferase family protein [Candidatus Dormibacteraceae bacterium]
MARAEAPDVAAPSGRRPGDLADGNLWLHFTRTSDWIGPEPSVPILDRGEGCYLWDTTGKRYLDGLSALFCVQVGYGRPEMPEAAARQMTKLPYATNWATAHQPAIDLAQRLAGIFPGDLNHLFFVNSGSEAVESALKLGRQYHQARGEAGRYKVISRRAAYHGTTMGAMGVTGIAALTNPYQPLVPGHFHVPTANPYRCGASHVCPPCNLACARSIEQVIEAEGPETVSAVFLEPVQNSGGCFTPPPGYLEEVRRVCDEHGVLMVLDEVICAFGRIGAWSGAELYGVTPDVITFAKGVTSGYAPLGGIAFSDRIAEAFTATPRSMFMHGSTWGGHPVSCAVAMANLDVIEKEDLIGNVLRNQAWLYDQLNDLRERHEMVGDVRGTGYFWALELVADRESKRSFSDEQAESLLRGFLSPRLLELGLICRADDRDEPVLQISPPLIATRTELGEMVSILDQALAESQARMAAS